MQHVRCRRHAAWAALFLCCLFMGTRSYAGDGTKLLEGDRYRFSAGLYERTDVIMMDNTVDLDSKKRDDRVQYIGFDYNAVFDLDFKEAGPRYHFRLARSGIYGYDVPVIINNTLTTYVGKIHPYHDAEYLPKLDTFWADFPVAVPWLRFKGGLFDYGVGHGIAVGGNYNNYGIELATDREDVNWRFYYCWPDFSNKHLLGPYIKQEKPQGIDYEHSKASYFATDVLIEVMDSVVQPYCSLLLDRTDTRRLNFFQTPTREDALGTVGMSVDLNYKKWSLSAEFARNFGAAESSDPDMPRVEHTGYAVYADASYAFERCIPRTRFIYASGNTVTDDMAANGDTRFPGGKNRAFSTFSPLNYYLADAIYPDIATMPLVACGNGYGINYGVPRPTTFLDPGLMENIVLVDVGAEVKVTKKLTVAVDWWYLSAAEKGIGMFNNVPKTISPDLGHEVDVEIDYQATPNIRLSGVGGIFFPGAAYREERDDTGGSLFTPFVRGDGKADPAYQVEMSLEMAF